MIYAYILQHKCGHAFAHAKLNTHTQTAMFVAILSWHASVVHVLHTPHRSARAYVALPSAVLAEYYAGVVRTPYASVCICLCVADGSCQLWEVCSGIERECWCCSHYTYTSTWSSAPYLCVSVSHRHRRTCGDRCVRIGLQCTRSIILRVLRLGICTGSTLIIICATHIAHNPFLCLSLSLSLAAPAVTVAEQPVLLFLHPVTTHLAQQ